MHRARAGVPEPPCPAGLGSALAFVEHLTASERICKYDSMKVRISATETARRLSELMNRVRYRGESFIVERGGKPVCEILPAQPARFSGKELADLLRSLPKPDEGYLALAEKLSAKQSTVAESRWPR